VAGFFIYILVELVPALNLKKIRLIIFDRPINPFVELTTLKFERTNIYSTKQADGNTELKIKAEVLLIPVKIQVKGKTVSVR
jgi:hypothetical protein